MSTNFCTFFFYSVIGSSVWSYNDWLGKIYYTGNFCVAYSENFIEYSTKTTLGFFFFIPFIFYICISFLFIWLKYYQLCCRCVVVVVVVVLSSSLLLSSTMRHQCANKSDGKNYGRHIGCDCGHIHRIYTYSSRRNKYFRFNLLYLLLEPFHRVISFSVSVIYSKNKTEPKTKTKIQNIVTVVLMLWPWAATYCNPDRKVHFIFPSGLQPRITHPIAKHDQSDMKEVNKIQSFFCSLKSFS